MRVIAISRLRSYWNSYPEVEGDLRAWYRTCDKAAWNSFAEVKEAFPRVDQIADRLIFNIRGNRYRLIVAVDYERHGLLVKWFGTHADYDKVDARTI